jgi:hypothetical protein
VIRRLHEHPHWIGLTTAFALEAGLTVGLWLPRRVALGAICGVGLVLLWHFYHVLLDWDEKPPSPPAATP